MSESIDLMLQIAQDLIDLRKKPTTEERFKRYPTMLMQLREAIDACDDPARLKALIALDSGYYLLAGDRQRAIEKWLSYERTPEVLRLYAMQLMLFGDVDDYGEADTNVDARVDALNAEADTLESAS